MVRAGGTFDQAALVAAFEVIGEAAVRNGARLDLFVYGGSALMLASNFRFATEDVDIAQLDQPWPAWFETAVADTADRNQWSRDWINDAVSVHLSPLATRSADHIEFASYPSTGETIGLCVAVPTADYLLALKLKAIRILDPVKGQQEADDIWNLMRLLQIESPEEAVAILARYFPRSGKDPAKQLFLLRHLKPSPDMEVRDAPQYGR